MEANRNLGCGDNGGAEERSNGAIAVADQLTEDEKMEKFFDLIKNYKEARDRQRIEMQRLPAGEESYYDGAEDYEEPKRKTKKFKLGDRNQPIWTPAFKWEDFMKNAGTEVRRLPVMLPASNFREIGQNSNMQKDTKDSSPVPADIEGGGLDLKLGL